uniref:BTB/POZ domain-containing protein n=1 Tax=Solanum tuberosum TaxID=4113 RepID=M0ZJX4_SOLTU
MAEGKVETLSRLAQWRIDNFAASTYKRSDPFKIGIWNWYVSSFFDLICLYHQLQLFSDFL